MPRSKMKMDRKRQNDIDAASEALLENMTDKEEVKTKQRYDDDPFVDEDGDLKVVPTLEDLSSLVEADGSVNTIPMVEILRRQLRVTLRAIEMAEIAYHATPRQGQATALTQMQSTAQDLMQKIEAHQDPEIFAEELTELVIKPMIYEFIKVVTSEAEKKRAQIMTVVPPQSAGVVRHEMSDLLAGITKGLDEAFDEAKRKLREMMGSKIKRGK